MKNKIKLNKKEKQMILKFGKGNEMEKKSLRKRKMGRSFCPVCKRIVNTFIVDEDIGFQIRLCLKCVEVEGFSLNLKNAIRCNKCGELFVPQKSSTCPVCWIEYFRIKNGGIYGTNN